MAQSHPGPSAGTEAGLQIWEEEAEAITLIDDTPTGQEEVAREAENTNAGTTVLFFQMQPDVQCADLPQFTSSVCKAREGALLTHPLNTPPLGNSHHHV